MPAYRHEPQAIFDRQRSRETNVMRTSGGRRSSSTFEVQNDNADGEILADKYQMLEELGSGSFGVVYKAIEKSTGEIVAIKHVSIVCAST